MPQKAFCKDFDRLRNSFDDLNYSLRHVPEPGDADGGGGGEPRPTEVPAGTWQVPLDLGDLGLSGSGLYLHIDGSSGGYLSTEPHAVEGDLAEPRYIWHLNKGTISSGEFANPSEVLESVVWGWLEGAYDEIIRLRAAYSALNEWANGVGEGGGDGVDNSATRAALLECIARLILLESAISETMRKWREH